MSNSETVSIIINILILLYIILIFATNIKVIQESKNSSKALGHLLLINMVPVIGVIAFYTFGVNHRKERIFERKLDVDTKENEQRLENIEKSTLHLIDEHNLKSESSLIRFLLKNSKSPLTANNTVELVINGEQKMPQLMDAINNAKNHIHLMYYIFENDETGRSVEEVLIKKAKEGVSIRFIYDDLGSSTIQGSMEQRLKDAGIRIYPFHNLTFGKLTDRLNYRNHRKIVVVDGQTGFIGGINISNSYVNDIKLNNKVYWRDTHLKIAGEAVHHLQFIFLCDWNFCSKENLKPTKLLFPQIKYHPRPTLVQLVASGPDSPTPSIMYSILQSISSAEKEILITTPYLIPGNEIQAALIIAAQRGISVSLLVPKKSDSRIVELASSSYFEDFLRAGIAIYRYEKGFVHAKSMVVDRKMSTVGTANMDVRSFDLNFEVNAIVYDEDISKALAEAFESDCKEASLLELEDWSERSKTTRFKENSARLLSPVL
jgi:cardiolipin synthase